MGAGEDVMVSMMPWAIEVKRLGMDRVRAPKKMEMVGHSGLGKGFRAGSERKNLGLFLIK